MANNKLTKMKVPAIPLTILFFISVSLNVFFNRNHYGPDWIKCYNVLVKFFN